jgi:hypothetical protein
MSFVIEFLPEAGAEVMMATEYYERRVPGLGVRFRLVLESVCAAIVQHPVLWHERPGGIGASIFQASRIT